MVIHCTNPTCRALVTQPTGRCPTCHTPLLYRLLLAVGDGGQSVRDVAPPSGTRIAERYLVWKHPVWLDTCPDYPIASVESIPPRILPYLRLSPLIQHIPRPYDYLTSAVSGLGVNILLLESAPLALTLPATDSDPIQVHFLPLLSQAWTKGTALQQLNWLRQIAALWPALAEERVVSTLLSPDTLRVDQALLRLTHLVADPAQPPPLAALGHRWQTWAYQAQPALQEYLGWLATALAHGKFPSASALLAELEQAIQTLAAGLRVTVEWGTATDQGPSRDRNEDACFPQGAIQTQRVSGRRGQPSALPLLLVCDGIGGHEQGNIASQTAIQALVDALSPLAQQADLSPGTVAHILKQTLIQVNTTIANRNNDEHRSARARMGTTAVLALVHAPYVSIAHLGDSRAYRVSPRAAYALTLDDDIASREVRLGYALYQEAVHMSGGGALVQALGISDSDHLYPTVQHFLIDDPCVLLLCSDGLSDHDRVETLWPHTLAPLAGTNLPLAPTVQTLIQWANRLNGHDNVTVGLMRFSPQTGPLPTLPATALAQSNPNAVPLDPATAETRVMAIPTPSPTGGLRRWPWRPLLSGAIPTLLLLVGGLGTYTAWQPQPVALRPLPPWPQAISGLALDLGRPEPAAAPVTVGSFWQRSSAASPPHQPDPLGLVTTPQAAAAPTLPTLATGSIVKVIDQRHLINQTQWVYLQVCAIPAGATAQSPQVSKAQPPFTPSTDRHLGDQLAQPGRQGWVNAQALRTHATPLRGVPQSQQGMCPGP